MDLEILNPEVGGSQLHSTFRLLEVHDGSPFSSDLEIHVVELPKRDLDEGTRQAEPALLAWSRFFAAESDDEVQEVCMEHPEIQKANQVLTELSRDPATQELARQRQLALDLHRIEIAAAKHEGVQEGVREGRSQLLLERRPHHTARPA